MPKILTGRLSATGAARSRVPIDGGTVTMADPALDPVPPRVTDRRTMPGASSHAGSSSGHHRDCDRDGRHPGASGCWPNAVPLVCRPMPRLSTPTRSALTTTDGRFKSRRTGSRREQAQSTQSPLGLPGAAPLDAVSSRPSPDVAPASVGVAASSDRRRSPAIPPTTWVHPARRRRCRLSPPPHRGPPAAWPRCLQAAMWLSSLPLFPPALSPAPGRHRCPADGAGRPPVGAEPRNRSETARAIARQKARSSTRC